MFSLQEAVDTLGLKEGVPEHRWYMLAGNNLIQTKNHHKKFNMGLKGADLPEFVELIRSGNPVNFYRASLMMVRAYGEQSWDKPSERLLPEKVAMQALDEMLFYVHRDEVFDEQVLEAFDTAKDIYKWVRD